MIQTISRCNAECGFCPYPSIRDLPHGVMEEGLFEKIIDDLARSGGRIVNIMPYLMNEPLLDRNLIPRIRLIKSRMPETCVHFLTNGSLLDDKTGDDIISSPLDWIGISFFGAKRETYEKSMGLEFDLVRSRVEKFIRKAVAARGADFVMITFFKWLNDDAEINDSLRYWQDLGVTRISHYEGGVSRAGNSPSIPPPVKTAMQRCDSIWTEGMFHILYNGDVVPCCMDWKRKHVLGSVRNSSVREIWAGEHYRNFRKVIRGIQPLTDDHLCSRCEMAAMRRKKIVMIHPHDIFSHKEPWTIRIKALARELQNSGFETEIITFALDGFEEAPFFQDGLRIHTLLRKISPVYFFKKISLIRRIIRDADVVWLQKAFHYCAVPAVTAALLEKKYIHYDWDDDETAIFFSGAKTPSYLIGAGLFILEQLIPRLSDSVSFSSERLKEKLQGMGLGPEKIFKLPVGADPVRTDPADVEKIRRKYGLNGVFSIIYTGQLHGGQYAGLLIDTAAELKRRGLKFRMLIAGDGYDRPRLERRASAEGLEEIIFTGYVPHELVPVYLEACTVAVAPFERNSVTLAKSPLKIAEYIAAGKAIIAHDAGEVREMLDGCGILADPLDRLSLCRAIHMLYDSPDLVRKMEAAARERGKIISWKSRVKNIRFGKI